MTKPALGYIEEIQLPDLGIACNAKVDTGACTSSLHAELIEPFSRHDQLWVRFHVRFSSPVADIDQTCEAVVIAQRTIASSNGQRAKRYIIETLLSAGGQSWPIEVSLSDRGSMKYPMLIGRKAIAGRFVVDVSDDTNDNDEL
ncbi:ATP-dependent zinc protease family protein [Thalassolituus sp. LLYu03]|uniref:ATP-dependent zinc protease family protein n=1 Tax=Thalassolituus sp. LLYu03 TaxID=3421656 RepID=UPI003D2B3BBC